MKDIFTLKTGLIEKKVNESNHDGFTGKREFYSRPNQLGQSYSYQNGKLHGKCCSYISSHANIVHGIPGNILYEHYYDNGKLLYSVRHNYIYQKLISKFIIKGNDIEVVLL